MKLSPSTLEQVHTCMSLIKQHRTTLEALQAHMTSVIREDTGADIGAEQWELDPSTGELTPLTPTYEGVKNA